MGFPSLSLVSTILRSCYLVIESAMLISVAGRLNQAEFSDIIDPILASPNGDVLHYHNRLLMGLYGNVTREMPDQGLAPWVSANDKPTTAAGNKPTTGDAKEKRLKGDVMQLPSRDRRRIKDLSQNDVSIHTHYRPLYAGASLDSDLDFKLPDTNPFTLSQALSIRHANSGVY